MPHTPKLPNSLEEPSASVRNYLETTGHRGEVLLWDKVNEIINYLASLHEGEKSSTFVQTGRFRKGGVEYTPTPTVKIDVESLLEEYVKIFGNVGYSKTKRREEIINIIKSALKK